MTGELAAAVCQVMRAATYVQATGFNSHNRYHYASDADLLVMLQPAMAEAGLALIPHDVEVTTTEVGTSGRGNTNWRTDLIVSYLLVHTSGDSVIVQAPGCGIDQQDKGVYKAMTGALKYALRHLFLVPTGNDPERAQPPEPPRQPDPPPRPVRRPTPPQAAGRVQRPQGARAAAVSNSTRPAITDASKVPADVVESLKAHDMTPATLIEDVRDFVHWVSPPGRAFDPWAASEKRIRGLPAWLDGQGDSMAEWTSLAVRLHNLLGSIELANLDRWLVNEGRAHYGRQPREDRLRLVEFLRQPGQLDKIARWVKANPRRS